MKVVILIIRDVILKLFSYLISCFLYPHISSVLHLLHSGFLLGWYFPPWRWMWQRSSETSVHIQTDYTALYPRQWQYSLLPLWEPQILQFLSLFITLFQSFNYSPRHPILKYSPVYMLLVQLKTKLHASVKLRVMFNLLYFDVYVLRQNVGATDSELHNIKYFIDLIRS
jgi:hypothetical protein